MFKQAEKRVVILGVNPIVDTLLRSAEDFAHALNLNNKLKIDIFYESSTENFHQSTSYSLGDKKTRFSKLEQLRKRVSGQSKDDQGLRDIIREKLESLNSEKLTDTNVSIRQHNLRLPGNLILVDERVFFCPILSELPTKENYKEIEQNSEQYNAFISYIESALLSSDSELYSSTIGEELIWVYDNDDTPRGIYPRKSFYTTEYGRYVVWVFIFNRNGKLLLQQRSPTTKDNRGLWDKSIGGHVDLADASTSVTAKRELIEETYLPDAEFTDHVKADLGDVIDFGELNFKKRPERHLKSEIKNLGKTDWAMFRATGKAGKPLKIRRVSERIMNVSDTETEVKRTIFHADIFLMIAPEGEFTESQQLQENLPSGEKAAVSRRRLLSIDELNTWVTNTCDAGKEKSTFTDDLIYINTEYLDMLDEFSEFVKFVQTK